MGQTESSETNPGEGDYAELISQLSLLEVAAVSASFKELHAKAGHGGQVLNLEAFSEYFKLPLLLGERLFQALDCKKTNTIDFEEFVSGVAMLLHGSFHEKCQLLFSMFNISGGDGIDRNELSTMLNIILSSTQLVLKGCGKMQNSALLNEGAISDIVTRIVEQAFHECDVSRTNKLSPNEFEMWLQKNPELVEHLVKWTLPSDKQLTYKLGGIGNGDQESDVILTSPSKEGLLPLSDVNTPEITDTHPLDEEDPVSKPSLPIVRTTSELEELDTMMTIPDAIQDSNQECLLIPTDVSPSSHDSGSDDENIHTNKSDKYATCPHFMLTADEYSIYSTLWIPGVVTREAMQQRKYINQHPIPQDLTCHESIAPHKIESRLTDYDIRVGYQPRICLAEVEVTSGGLEKLVGVGNYIDALHLTRDLILQTRSVSAKQNNVEYSPLILQMWLARFSLMLKLGLKRELEDEIEALAGSNFDRPDMYFEFYPDRYGGKCGWMVPFGLVLLYSSLPHLLGQHRRSLDRLYFLLHTAQRVKQHILGLEASELAKSKGINLWQKRINRIFLAIGSTFVSLKDYYNARLIFSNMAKEQPAMLADCSIIKSRIYILVGNIPAATQELQIAKDNLENPEQYPRYLMACGLLEIAERRFSQAEQTFRRVLELSPCSSAMNNIGFCLYYQAHMDQALECWEANLYSDPPESIHSAHLANIKSVVGILPGSGYSIKMKILDVLAKRSPELIRHIL
ncbi:hypothetical protein LOD99_4287 [Oopsacas minuta]|uniref:EF-hand domain-containing protein n=1 Tax=Oopsacas minuta TaxID=111878 RepID=A0AAV7JY38_9METZ|nr:hypothetical protein LOD99_4287 [Oopsacas minuta]